MDREQEVIYEQCRTKALEYANSPEAAASHYDFHEAYDSELIRLVRDAALEEAKQACVAWGDEKVRKWSALGDAEMIDDAKASAWDARQCAAAIDALRSKP